MIQASCRQTGLACASRVLRLSAATHGTCCFALSHSFCPFYLSTKRHLRPAENHVWKTVSPGHRCPPHCCFPRWYQAFDWAHVRLLLSFPCNLEFDRFVALSYLKCPIKTLDVSYLSYPSFLSLTEHTYPELLRSYLEVGGWNCSWVAIDNDLRGIWRRDFRRVRIRFRSRGLWGESQHS